MARILDYCPSLVPDLPDGKGKTVVITGGNRGIGLEAVKKILPQGYHVIIGKKKSTLKIVDKKKNMPLDNCQLEKNYSVLYLGFCLFTRGKK